MSHEIPGGEEVLCDVLMATEKTWHVDDLVAKYKTAMGGQNDWRLAHQNSKLVSEIARQNAKLEGRIADVESYIGKQLVVSVVSLKPEEGGRTLVTGEIMDWDAKEATFELSTAEGNCVKVVYAVPKPIPEDLAERYAEQGQTYFGHTRVLAMTVLQENAFGAYCSSPALASYGYRSLGAS